MEEAVKIIIGIAAAIAGLIGLFLAARSVDTGIELFGFLLFVFAIGLNFWFIKRHCDTIDQKKQTLRLLKTTSAELNRS